MKKLSLSIVTALVFFVATAMAQTTPATDPQGTTPTTASPSNQTSTPEAQAPAAQPGTSTSSSTSMKAEPKGEKKLKGCIESENGKFVLENKHGKEITLTGQDLSAHVGHQVVVHGAFQSGMAASASGENADEIRKLDSPEAGPVERQEPHPGGFCRLDFDQLD